MLAATRDAGVTMDKVAEDETKRWLERPWLMAAVGAVTGLLIHWLGHGWWSRAPSDRFTPAALAFVGVAGLTFLLTAERKRLPWALLFSLGWGLVIGLIGWFTTGFNIRPSIFEFPFWSGLLAVIVAAPLFQVVRDEGRWRLPYAPLHRYAWTDAIIGGASLAFTGLTFLLAFLLGQLFAAIGIGLLRELLEKGWFEWMMAGAAFGAASAVLREREPLLGTLQRLLMVVFSVLAPVLAGALLLFLIALPVTGFAGLWKSGLPETPLLLSSAAFAIVLLNAIIGDSPDDRSPGKLWRATSLALVLVVLPLALLALISMGIRVGQYGWTPARIWGVIASLLALGYGIAGWLAVAKRRGAFDEPLRGYQTRLAVALCGLALLLALPLLDFGAISANSQMARLAAGKVKPAAFDWAAMAFDFGPAGRERLKAVARRGTPDQRVLAAAALNSDSRYKVAEIRQTVEDAAGLEQRLRILSPEIVMDEALKRRIAATNLCGAKRQCAVLKIDDRRLLVISESGEERRVQSTTIRLDQIEKPGMGDGLGEYNPPPEVKGVDLRTAPVEIRGVARRQLFVDGKPVGEPFE